MGYDHIANGDISIIRDQQPKDRMMPDIPFMPDLLMREYYPTANFLVNIGVRYEYSHQWVNYATDGGGNRNEIR